MNKGKLKVTNLAIWIIVVKKFQRNIYNFNIAIQPNFSQFSSQIQIKLTAGHDFSIYYWKVADSQKCFSDVLRDLAPFARFKKQEKYPWRSATFSKVAGF